MVSDVDLEEIKGSPYLLEAYSIGVSMGAKTGALKELESLSEWIGNFSEPDVELIVLHIAQRLKELKLSD